MLPKEHRLRHEKDMKTLFAKGKGVFDAVAGLKYRPNGLSVSRFAVVVGSKVSKSAVKRNRLRRQVRAVLQERLDAFKPGYDIAIIIRPEARDLLRDELEARVLASLKKSPIL